MTGIDLSLDRLMSTVVDNINSIVPHLANGLVALGLGYLVLKLAYWLAGFILSLISLPRGLRSIVMGLIQGILWVILVFAVLQALGLGGVILFFSSSLAVFGIVLAAGGATLTADILGGLFLARDRDFSVGDEVSAGEGPTVGLIEAMDMRRTRIRDKQGKLHVIPNAVIASKEWIVLNKRADLKKAEEAKAKKAEDKKPEESKKK